MCKKIFSSILYWIFSNNTQVLYGFFQNIVTFTNGFEIAIGQASGNVEEDLMTQIQIKETINGYLDITDEVQTEDDEDYEEE